MARVRLNETQDVAEDHRWIFERIEARGPILNIFRAMSHSPEAMLRFMRFGSYFLEQGKLDPKLRELAILRVARRAGAEYEWVQHVVIARAVGVTDAQIEALERGDDAADCFDDGDRLLLAFTDDVVRDGRPPREKLE